MSNTPVKYLDTFTEQTFIDLISRAGKYDFELHKKGGYTIRLFNNSYDKSPNTELYYSGDIFELIRKVTPKKKNSIEYHFSKAIKEAMRRE